MNSVFISSTFRDMHFERDVLNNTVNARLNRRLSEYNQSVRLLDLRWGVDTSELSEEEATARVLRVCFDGIDSCIYCTVPSFQNNEYRVTFPDPGDRERARATDDEMILTVPAARMEEFMKSVEENQRMGFNDRMQCVELDYARPPFYNTLFEMWGLEQGSDWNA